VKDNGAKFRDKIFFTVEDLAKFSGIKRQSAWVLCSRYVGNGRFVRLKNNFYVLAENWRSLTIEKFFELTNFLQVPSYISFLTALSYYGTTTQVVRNYFESAALKRSASFEAEAVRFRYFKMKKAYYFGFEKKENFFIATMEKALLDAVYLHSFGKYRLDFNAINGARLDKNELKRMTRRYPEKTRRIMEKLCKTL
jgi:predicted transcriptional regulator of viral defense system